jgi:hypothetical protein
MLLQAAPFFDKNVLIMEKTKGILAGTSLYKGANSVTIITED